MSAVEAIKLTYPEYLALEERSESKHEYLHGEAWAMAGGTIEHGRLQMVFATELAIALGGKPCVVLSSDVRVDETEAAQRCRAPQNAYHRATVRHEVRGEDGTSSLLERAHLQRMLSGSPPQ